MYKTQKIIAIGIMVVLLVTSVSVVIRGDDPPGEGNGSQTYEYEYVIITSEDLKSCCREYNFWTLCDFRSDQGLTATIMTIEEIVSNPDYGVNGKWGDGNITNPYISEPVTCNLGDFDDTQARIRNFIRFAHTVWNTTYVLLGGTNDILPARQLYFGAAELYYSAVSSWFPDAGIPKVETDVSGPSDLYYSCLEGSFNSNGNDKWGEPSDGQDIPCGSGDVDLEAEVYVGRAPVANWDEISNFVRKTLTYENSEDPYVRNVLMIGQILAHPDSSHCQVEEILWGGKSLDTLVDGVIPLFEMGDYEPGDYIPIDFDARAQLPEGGEYVPPVKFTEGKGIPSSRYSIYTLYDRAPRAWGTPDSQGRLIVWPPNPNWGWPKETTLEFANNAGIHIINHLGSIIEYPKCSPIVGHFMKLKDKYLMNINWRYEDLPYYNIPDLMDFKNQDKPFFIYSQDCFSGSFDYCHPSCLGYYGEPLRPVRCDYKPSPPEHRQYWECPAETLITEDGGAFAAIMPSRHGWVGAGENSKISLIYNQEFWKAIFPSNKNDPHTTILSKANQLSKEALINHINEKGMRWGYYGLNYFGDPALALHVISHNDPPVAFIDSICPNPADEETSVYFVGHGEDSDGSITDYNWRSSKDGQLSKQSSFDISSLSSGTHTIYFKVKDNDDTWSPEVTDTLVINGLCNDPPTVPSQPCGPTSGTIETSYTYSTSATDPDGDEVKYYFDWGDGTGDWTSLVNSAESASLSHTWNSAGTYYVKAKAIGEHGAQSDFSSELTVIICNEQNSNLDPDDDDDEEDTESKPSLFDLLCSLLNREINFVESIQQLLALIFT